MMKIDACPLCHQEKARYRQEGHAIYEDGQWRFSDRPRHILYCTNCGHQISSYDDKNTAIFKWNHSPIAEWERNWYYGVD